MEEKKKDKKDDSGQNMNLCNTHDKVVVIIISIFLHITNIVFAYFKKSIVFPKSKRAGRDES